MPHFSIVIPVYNRPEEVNELLESLALQTEKEFEVIIVEDGSSLPCKEVVERYTSTLSIQYHSKKNTGRSDTRNYGIAHATGDYLLFFDSDCIIPPRYMETVKRNLEEKHLDCFGGPDMANDSFTPKQKAINYAMTSFFTTGGIRGSKRKLERFNPRSFNMGISKAVFSKVEGFKDIYAEDIDLSIRIRKEGFSIGLFHDAAVYHKRRVSFRQFFRQVNTFGKGRIGLYKLHHDSLKIVHTLPALFILYFILVVVCCTTDPFAILPLILYSLLLLIDASIKTKSLKIGLLSMYASYVQLFGYGIGFWSALVEKIIMKREPEDAETLKKKYK